MKKFTKLIGLMLALSMVFAFTACGSESEPAEEAATAEGIDLSAGIERYNDEETGEATVESEVFEVTLPDGDTWDYEVVEPTQIVFYNKAAREGDFGGTLFTLQVFDADDESYDIMPNAVVGEKGDKKIVAVFTSDVEYDFNDEAATEEYMRVYDVVQKIGTEDTPLEVYLD